MKLLELQSDPAAFQQGIHIATGSGPRRFGDCMADFQRERFTAVNPSLLAVARHEAPPVPRIWDERTKGASKDTDWTVNLLWLLAFSRRPLRMQVGAFDSEQADEVRLIVKDILRTDGPINDFLRQVTEAQSDKIINSRTGSVIEILTSDKFGSHGSRIDLLLLNELTHQPSSGFAETLFDNLDKMPNALGVVATNSGHDPSWQLDWKSVFAAAPDRWLMLAFNRPSPWVSAAALAEAEKRNPPGRFQRLWHGIWTPEEGSAALSAETIAAAFVPGLQPQQFAEYGVEYCAGVDLGISRDASAVCILGVRRRHDGHGRIRLAYTKRWQPTPGKRVDLQEVEDTLRDLHLCFGFAQLQYDPWQAVHLASRLQAGGLGRMVAGTNRKPGLPMVECPPTGSNLQRMATALLSAFADRRVELFDDPDLKRDLQRLRIEERSFGFRLVAPHDAFGHGDLGTAFSLALLAASELAARKVVVAGAVSSSALDGTGGSNPYFGGAAWQARVDAYQREMAELGGHVDDGQGPWRRIAEEFGRGPGLPGMCDDY